jgi:hypothetical protein
MTDPRNTRSLLLLGMLSLTACPPRHNNAADGGSPSSGSSVQPFASNAGDVTRFQDEVPLGPEAIVAQDGTIVRASPESGDAVATLSKGAAVTELSTHGTMSLVVFDDPKGGNHRLMGWVLDAALEDVGPSPTPPVAPLTDGGGGGLADAVAPSPSPTSPNPSPGKHHHHHRPHQ